MALVAAVATAVSTAMAQTATVTGRISAAQTRAGVPGAVVLVEGTRLRSVSDSAGRFQLSLVPPGPQVLLARRIGFAPARIAVVVPARGELLQDITLAETALRLPELIVTADPVSRARDAEAFRMLQVPRQVGVMGPQGGYQNAAFLHRSGGSLDGSALRA